MKSKTPAHHWRLLFWISYLVFALGVVAAVGTIGSVYLSFSEGKALNKRALELSDNVDSYRKAIATYGLTEAQENALVNLYRRVTLDLAFHRMVLIPSMLIGAVLFIALLGLCCLLWAKIKILECRMDAEKGSPSQAPVSSGSP